jgi:hypothetical protein
MRQKWVWIGKPSLVWNWHKAAKANVMPCPQLAKADSLIVASIQHPVMRAISF